MKKRVTATSKEAFAKIQKSLGKRQREVFNCIKETGSITAKGISYSLNLPINHITGRISEIMYKQLIRVKGTVKDVSNNSQRVNLYVIRKDNDPLNVFAQSWEDKFSDLTEWLDHEYPHIFYEFEVLINHKI